MRLVIAEKPSLAAAIKAAGLPDVTVTYCYGHMLRLAMPGEYEDRWKRWSVAALPIRIAQWKLLPDAGQPGKVEQLDRIQKLLASASEVIHAGDPDREGQLLVDEVLDHFRWRGPTKRLLVTDVRPEAIKQAFATMKDNARYQPLRMAAECRSRADWLVGMNLTPAATKLLGNDSLIPVGRVQTPTLALVYRRRKEMDAFSEQVFYTLNATFNLAGGRSLQMRCEPDPKILDRATAATLAAGIKGAQQPLSVEVKERAKEAPMPYNLGDFQKDAERYYGWSLKAALAALQKAYEAAWVSYPRSDCRYMPGGHKADAAALGVNVAAQLGVPSSKVGPLAPHDATYDSSKVTVHYGIVPTGAKVDQSGDADAVKAWKLVALHYLRTLMPHMRYTEVSATAMVQTRDLAVPALRFRAIGRTIHDGRHWMQFKLDEFIPPRGGAKKKTKAAKEPTVLPRLTDGEDSVCGTCNVAQGKTTPPKPYTQASLQEDMENVAKFATDDKVRAVLRDAKGIGTVATQAGIVDGLIRHSLLIQDSKGRLDISDFGMGVIEALPEQVTSPVLTAAWESALGMIAKSEYEPSAFMEKLDGWVEKRIAWMKHARENGKCLTVSLPKQPTATQDRSRVGTKDAKRNSSKTREAPRRSAFL